MFDTAGAIRLTGGAVIALLLLRPAPCSADQMPTWNMHSFCASRMPASAVADCVHLQEEAGAAVRSRWSAYSAREREECVAYVIEDDIPPSYMRLKHCLDTTLKGK